MKKGLNLFLHTVFGGKEQKQLTNKEILLYILVLLLGLFVIMAPFVNFYIFRVKW